MMKRTGVIIHEGLKRGAVLGATLCALLSLGSLMEGKALAAQGWGLGIGYNNPVNANLGVSFLYAGQSFGFEAAIGGVGFWSESSENNDNSGGAIGGDVDLKYFFGQKIRGYVEAGIGYGAALSTGGGLDLNAGQGGGFAGAGALFQGTSLYGLVGGDYLFSSERTVFMATLGFWL